MTKKEELLKSFDELDSEYKRTIHFRGAFYHCMELWYPIRLFFILGETDGIDASKKFDYGNLLLLQDWIDEDDFRKFLHSLEDVAENTISSLRLRLPIGHILDPNEDTLRLQQEKGIFVSLNEYERILLTTTRSKPNTTLRKWPSRHFLFRFNPDSPCGNTFQNERFKPLPIKRDLPGYPDFFSAVNSFMGSEAGFINDWTIVFSLPITKAAIRTVLYGKDRFVVELQTLELPEDRLGCKYYLEYETKSPDTGELDFPGSGVIRVSAPVQRLYLVLFDKREPEAILDNRDYNWRTQSPSLSELEALYREEDIEYLVSGGEGDRLEFKAELGDKKEFLETVCSFSNTSGGEILVGIRNNGDPAGIDEGKLEGLRHSIIDSVRWNIEPQVQLDIKFGNYHDKNIIIVNVPKGIFTPYSFRNHGIYIRNHDRDMIASRDEVLRLSERLGTSLFQ